jgi:hypothetical protein
MKACQQTMLKLKGGFPHYILDLMLLNAGVDSKKINLVFEETDRLYSNRLSALYSFLLWAITVISMAAPNASAVTPMVSRAGLWSLNLLA